MVSRVYLDWNATTPLRPEARAAMAAAWEMPGNPSSVHAEGRAARALIEAARGEIAALVGVVAGARPAVVFTSGGTEANALALSPGWIADGKPVERLIVSAIEHPSVLVGGRFGSDRIEMASVDSAGVIDLNALRDRLSGKPPALVSVMAANNETGAIQPVAEVATIVHEYGGLLHVDAVQAFGRIICENNHIKADLLTVSGHKIGGPKGIGALVIADDRLAGGVPLLRGGGQEANRRAGTENLAGIAGFAAAARAAIAGRGAEQPRQTMLRERLERGLLETLGVHIFSQSATRLPNTTLFTAPGLVAETAVIAFDLAGIAISSGSACSSGKVTPSHVLVAMGVNPAESRGALRLSLGWETRERDIEAALEAWRKLIRVLLKSPTGTAA